MFISHTLSQLLSQPNLMGYMQRRERCESQSCPETHFNGANTMPVFTVWLLLSGGPTGFQSALLIIDTSKEKKIDFCLNNVKFRSYLF